MYPYGNFRKYYQARGAGRWADARLSVLPRDLFCDKEVADLGCNDGTLTLLLGYHYNPASILGVDIDYTLINRAVENWAALEHWHDRSEEIDTILSEIATLPLSYRLQVQETGELDALRHLRLQQLGPRAARFPANVSFLVGDVLTCELPSCLDTVLSLSTSKWIHLNWGDAGLRRLFAVAHSALRPGGHFVFEPQPWASYKKLKNQSLTYRTHYDEIRMRPKDFASALAEVGFEEVRTVGPQEGKEKFRRAITIFRKR